METIKNKYDTIQSEINRIVDELINQFNSDYGKELARVIISKMYLK